jgi:NAD(P)H-hydrate epimerase
MIGCLLAQNMPPFDAACLAVHLHGLAGQLAGSTLTQRSPLARDLLNTLPQAIAQYERR